jgi:hypothetical protein
MTQILVTKPGTLNRYDKAKLSKAGIVCVEAAEPADVKLIAATGAELSAGGMMIAAMRALARTDLANPSQVRHAFVEQILAEMEREQSERTGA